MASRVFISYRRADSEAVAGRLCEHLVERLGENNVFRDVGSIDAGRDFTEAIEVNLKKCDAALVLIGKNWIGAQDENTARRLDDPGDWVRLEVAATLQRKPRIPVIPVLLDDTKMPGEQELPEPLRPLRKRHAAKLRPDPDFITDVERILRHVPGVNRPVLLWNLGLAVALFALVAFWLFRYSNWLDSVLALTLGASLAVIGVLFKILPDSRIRASKAWIDERLFLNPKATVALSGLFVLTALAFTFFGGVRIVTAADSALREVAISDTEDPGDYSPIQGGERREVFWTLPWSPRELNVFVRDLPRARVTLGPWEVETLAAPSDFYRPALLVYCESVFLAESARKPTPGHVVRCRVSVGEKWLEERDYTGESFYLGCGNEVGLPPRIRETWEKILSNSDRGESATAMLRSFWTTLGECIDDVDLKVGDVVKVEIRNYGDPDGNESTVIGGAEITVDDPAQSGFPQALALKLKDS